MLVLDPTASGCSSCMTLCWISSIRSVDGRTDGWMEFKAMPREHGFLPTNPHQKAGRSGQRPPTTIQKHSNPPWKHHGSPILWVPLSLSLLRRCSGCRAAHGAWTRRGLRRCCRSWTRGRGTVDRDSWEPGQQRSSCNTTRIGSAPGPQKKGLVRGLKHVQTLVSSRVRPRP